IVRILTSDSYTIPRGTTVVLNAWGSGRSESLWGKQASHFRPERWLYGEPCMSSCLAFSVSRRSCIGRSYAKAILKTMLAHCVREFRFNSDAKNLSIKMDLVLRPISGHLLKVELRNDSH
ncbi:cytochrome P450 CYP366A1 precursor, partial [Danaus plexippus plexippus]